MLAKLHKAAWVKGDIYLQPKLDGCRAIWTGSKLLSRTGKEIKGVPALIQYLTEHFATTPLDGELYNHKKTFQELISSIRRTKNIEEDLDVQFHIYDLPIADVTFKSRLQLLNKMESDGLIKGRLQLVETHWIPEKNIGDLSTLNPYEAQGYEGTMLRNADGLYKFGKRSSDLMKIKTFQDAEFPIIGIYQLVRHEKLVTDHWVPGSHEKSNGQWSKDGEGTPDAMIGGLVLSIPGTDKTFECGTGYNDATRREFWVNSPVGKLATIKFQELTDDGIPRFPVFLRLRPVDLD